MRRPRVVTIEVGVADDSAATCPEGMSMKVRFDPPVEDGERSRLAALVNVLLREYEGCEVKPS